MTEKDIRDGANVLGEIVDQGAYLHIALKKYNSKAVHRLVCGTLEKYFELNAVLERCSTGKVKSNLKNLLLISLYAVKYSFEPYSVILGSVLSALTASGKGAVKGYFTAVLGKAHRTEYTLPALGEKGYEEITFNMPSWLIGMYRKDYPENYKEIILSSEQKRNHIVVFDESIEDQIEGEKSEYGYFVPSSERINELFRTGKITFMSLGSVMICKALGEVKGKNVLDVCASPGGKSVYLSQKGGASVTACDLHPHRVELIKSYASRVKADIVCATEDATVFHPERAESCDCVLCDVPCSGLGVIDKKRDIVLNKTYDDILAITETQKKILQNSAKYVKKGGILVYSTCTVFKKENDCVVEEFLQNNGDFSLERMEKLPENDGKKQFLPDGKGMEGFFVCRMRKR